ncbi:MAG: hypothetical protein H6Q90_6815 [Deltaproteobacteria bacterium]|nr:hypothetical protein [Deltaproteobacteria bacterium]
MCPKYTKSRATFARADQRAGTPLYVTDTETSDAVEDRSSGLGQGAEEGAEPAADGVEIVELDGLHGVTKARAAGVPRGSPRHHAVTVVGIVARGMQGWGTATLSGGRGEHCTMFQEATLSAIPALMGWR